MTDYLRGFGLPFWLDIDRPVYPCLTGDHRADAVVIGGGIAGLKIADYLAGHGMSSIVLEAARVGDGASSRNQGCIVSYLATPYEQLAAKVTRSTARSLFAVGNYNHQLLADQIARHEIECDYEILGQTMLVDERLPGWQQKLKAFRRDVLLLKEDGFEAEYLEPSDAEALTGSSRYAGGFIFPRDAQFHSGKFVIGLGKAVGRSKYVQIFEDSPAAVGRTTAGATIARTPLGSVTAPHIFLATNAFVPQLIPDLNGALRAERGQAFVTEPLDIRPCAGCFSTGAAWWREIPDNGDQYRLLFGGGRRRDEPESLFRQFTTKSTPNRRLQTQGSRPTVAHQRRLDRYFARYFPHLVGAKISHRWGGLQSFTFDGLPIIGLLDPGRGIYGIAGFSGMGNTYSNVGAAYLAARVAGAHGDLERRFGPTIELLMAENRDSSQWPGGEPTLSRTS